MPTATRPSRSTGPTESAPPSALALESTSASEHREAQGSARLGLSKIEGQERKPGYSQPASAREVNRIERSNAELFADVSGRTADDLVDGDKGDRIDVGGELLPRPPELGTTQQARQKAPHLDHRHPTRDEHRIAGQQTLCDRRGGLVYVVLQKRARVDVRGHAVRQSPRSRSSTSLARSEDRNRCGEPVGRGFEGGVIQPCSIPAARASPPPGNGTS